MIISSCRVVNIRRKLQEAVDGGGVNLPAVHPDRNVCDAENRDAVREPKNWNIGQTEAVDVIEARAVGIGVEIIVVGDAVVSRQIIGWAGLEPFGSIGAQHPVGGISEELRRLPGK